MGKLKDPRVLTDVGDVLVQEIKDCGVDDDRLMNVISESVKLVMEEESLRPLVLGGDYSRSYSEEQVHNRHVGKRIVEIDGIIYGEGKENDGGAQLLGIL